AGLGCGMPQRTPVQLATTTSSTVFCWHDPSPSTQRCSMVPLGPVWHDTAAQRRNAMSDGGRIYASLGSPDERDRTVSRTAPTEHHIISLLKKVQDLILSYNPLDQEAVLEARRLLEARGIETFLDRDQLVPGLPWPEALEEGLRSARAV